MSAMSLDTGRYLTFFWMAKDVLDGYNGEPRTYPFTILKVTEHQTVVRVNLNIQSSRTSRLIAFYSTVFAYGQTGSGKSFTMEGGSVSSIYNFARMSDLNCNRLSKRPV